MYHSKVQWPKVFVEWEVSQIVVDVEEESVLEVLWWFGVTNPVKFVCTSQI